VAHLFFRGGAKEWFQKFEIQMGGGRGSSNLHNYQQLALSIWLELNCAAAERLLSD